jgi:predicted transcriptional regulator
MPKAKPKKRVATIAKTVKLPEYLDRQVKQLAIDDNRSQQEIMAAAILEYIKDTNTGRYGQRKPSQERLNA